MEDDLTVPTPYVNRLTRQILSPYGNQDKKRVALVALPLLMEAGLSIAGVQVPWLGWTLMAAPLPIAGVLYRDEIKSFRLRSPLYRVRTSQAVQPSVARSIRSWHLAHGGAAAYVDIFDLLVKVANAMPDESTDITAAGWNAFRDEMRRANTRLNNLADTAPDVEAIGALQAWMHWYTSCAGMAARFSREVPGGVLSMDAYRKWKDDHDKAWTALLELLSADNYGRLLVL